MLSRYKITDAKLMLARGKSRKRIRWKTRLSRVTIHAIANGDFYCGRPDSPAYNPTEEEWQAYLDEWHKENPKRTRSGEIVPREMTKADICNVHPLNIEDLATLSRMLDDVAKSCTVDEAEETLDQVWTVADSAYLPGEPVPC